MPKAGLFATVRSLIQEFQSFGRPELQRLRREAEQLREEIEAVRATKERLQVNNEAFVLAQLKSALSQVQGASHESDRRKEAVSEVADSVGKQAALVEEAALHRKALESTQDLLQKVDLQKYIVEGAPVEECLRKPSSEGNEREKS